jgi:RNA polymerase sigma-70 factor (ECF subfamily)
LFSTGPYFDNEVEIKHWLSEISEDNQDAFSKLLRLFWNKVYTQALTYLKSTAVAQELTQDIFLKVWTNRKKLLLVDNFSGYLFIMTRNEIISLLRKKGLQSMEPDEKLEERIWIPDQQLDYKHSYERIFKGIDLLPPARKNIFKMSRVDGMTYDEIAAHMNISRDGVKDHIVKALLFLRNYIRTHSDTLPLLTCLLLDFALK